MNIINYLTKAQLNKTKMVQFKKGTTLFQEEEKCDSIGIIISGQVEVFTYLISGEKVIYNSLSSGEMFGSNLVFSSHPYYRGTVVALTDCNVCIIDKNTLKTLLSQNEEFIEHYLNSQSDFTKRLNFKIKMLSIPSAKDRLLFALENSKNNTLRFKTVTALAEYLGLARETTSRAITFLLNERLVKYTNKTITLKKE